MRRFYLAYMNLQHQFNKAVIISFGLSLLIVFLLYYFTVSQSMDRELRGQLNHAVNLQSLSVDFTMQSFITDIKALGSRTVIRRELHQYIKGNHSLEDLKAFTAPKYADGAAIIKNLEGVRRYLTNGTIVSQYGKQETLRTADLSKPGIFIPESSPNTVLVIEPIMAEDDTIGYDAGVFDIAFLWDQMPEGITHLRLLPESSPDMPSSRQYIKTHLPGQPFVLHATIDCNMLRTTKSKSLLIVLGYTLITLMVIAIIFYFTQFRWVKRIIHQLNNKKILLNNTQKLTRSGGWQYNAQTRETSWTKETYHIFGLQPNDSLVPGHDKIQAALRCFKRYDRRKLLQSINQCIKEGKIFDLTFPITTLSGSSRWIRFVLHPVNTDNGSHSLTGTLMDISLQRKAEQEHREKLELQKKMSLEKESTRFKQNFLANMSHELRTPLNGIIGMNEVLKMTSLSDDQQEYTESIEKSAQQLEEMVDRILNFTRIEAGNIELNKEKFHLHSFLRKTEKYFHRICDKPIRYQSAIKPGTPEIITADETRIFEVAANLVSNAVKFTREGSIILTAEASDFSADTHEVLIKIIVSDTGMGIKNEIKKEMIDPFYKLEESDTREFDGSGLGLAMSQRLVTLHGGEMDFTGIPGRGSSVWFTFRAGIQE